MISHEVSYVGDANGFCKACVASEDGLMLELCINHSYELVVKPDSSPKIQDSNGNRSDTKRL